MPAEVIRLNSGPFELEEARLRFLDLGLTVDDIFWHKEVWVVLGLEEPAPDMRWDLASKLQLEKVRRLDSLREALLVRDQIDLVSVHGDGYRIAKPSEQIGLAMDMTRQTMQRALAKGSLRVKHTDTSGFTEAERAQQKDALARLEGQQRMVRKPPRSPW